MNLRIQVNSISHKQAPQIKSFSNKLIAFLSTLFLMSYLPVSFANTVIQAEDYSSFSDSDQENRGGEYRLDAVDIQTTSDVGGGFNVGWIKSGEFLEYEVTLGAQEYQIQTRVASIHSTGAYRLLIDGEEIATDAVPNTGNWQTFVTNNVALFPSSNGGTHTVRIEVTGNDFNLNWISFNPLTSSGTTTLIQAEDYTRFSDSDEVNRGGEYRLDAVDIQATSDVNGGFNVGWIQSGEYLEYEVALDAQEYQIQTRVASIRDTGSYRILIDGEEITTDVVPNTGDWQTFVTNDAASFTNDRSGTHTLRIEVTGNDFNLNWISFNTQTTDTPSNPIEVSYTESFEDISNPDRGFYFPYPTLSSNFTPLIASELISRKNVGYTPFLANYTVKSSIGLRLYVLDLYRNSDLPNSFLTLLQNDFDTARSAGVRFIIRFAYNTTPTAGNCAVGFVCPPYLDASKQQILRHLTQLTNVLQTNSDVIVGLQHGFIGMWGENYYTDHFGDASPNADQGRLTNQNWLDRNEILDGLLDALPNNRMVQARFPQAKQRFIDGPNAPLDGASLLVSQAFDQSDNARIGIHNDCYLASADDFGTFADYGNDTGLFDPNANSTLRDYASRDTVYTLVGGETCSDGYSPQNNCASQSGQAVQDMETQHYSYLNSDYNNEVNNDWTDGLCMDEIKLRLGYRLVMRKMSINGATTSSGPVNLEFEIDNVGFAAPVNPRELWLVLRNEQNEYRIKLDGNNTNPQLWLADETTNVSANIALPNVSSGNYTVLLHIADPSDNNRVLLRPEFSVQLANEGTWENSTGYNSLNTSITVQ